MPHPSPAQVVHGSAAVIGTTLLMVLLFPSAPDWVVAPVTVVALAIGVLVALRPALRAGARSAPAAVTGASATPHAAPVETPGAPERIGADRPRAVRV
ncbi:hypothetical protein [Streptomyces sp. ST2-7A]|uniref:hypothetical protein n=1 Tax=Streptomyces sp. ST2-7A TaxID=2907214 RepID=UPI001F2C15D2|nr:hypothetical protein [Streptomyces sp. ST2-7A]MCE7082547.1 hypothetical protein [Streptomyces sp. ST2-7A]